MATKLFQKTFKKIRAHGRQYGCQQSLTTEQNTLYVDPGFENEFQYKNSFIGLPHLLIQWPKRKALFL